MRSPPADTVGLHLDKLDIAPWQPIDTPYDIESGATMCDRPHRSVIGLGAVQRIDIAKRASVRSARKVRQQCTAVRRLSLIVRAAASSCSRCASSARRFARCSTPRRSPAPACRELCFVAAGRYTQLERYVRAAHCATRSAAARRAARPQHNTARRARRSSRDDCARFGALPLARGHSQRVGAALAKTRKGTANCSNAF